MVGAAGSARIDQGIADDTLQAAAAAEQLLGIGILSPEEQLQAIETARQASFVPDVSDVPPPRRRPAPRSAVEREEA